MDGIWQEHLGSWRTTTAKYTVEIWEINSEYSWAVYNNEGEYIFAGKGRTIEIAKREALFAAR